MAKKVTGTNEPRLEQINANTQIVFTMKGFIGTILTILGMFYGFYQLIVVPKINMIETNYKDMFNEQKQQNTIFYQELGKINTSIGSLNATIEALNRNRTTNQNLMNSGGSFGGDNNSQSSGSVYHPDGNH